MYLVVDALGAVHIMKSSFLGGIMPSPPLSYFVTFWLPSPLSTDAVDVDDLGLAVLAQRSDHRSCPEMCSHPVIICHLLAYPPPFPSSDEAIYELPLNIGLTDL